MGRQTRSVVLPLSLPILWLLSGCSGSGPMDGEAAMAHVRHLVGIGPRPAGSEALAKATDYICKELEAIGLRPNRQEWEDPKEKMTLRNVWAQIDGKDPQNGPILVIGAHYDTKLADGVDGRKDIRFVGAIDGGGATGTLLEIGRVLTTPEHRPDVNVWLLFIDGEESIAWDWEPDRALLGSKYFVKTMSEDKKLFPKGLKSRMKAFILLDLIGASDIKIDRDTNSNEELQDLFLKAAARMGEDHRVYNYESGWTDDHESFNDYGIPSVLLIDFAYRIPGQQQPAGTSYAQWWHTAEDTLDKMSPEALAFAGNLVLKALPDVQQWISSR